MTDTVTLRRGLAILAIILALISLVPGTPGLLVIGAIVVLGIALLI